MEDYLPNLEDFENLIENSSSVDKMLSHRGLKFYSLAGWLLGENPACEDRFSNSLASAANVHYSDNHANIIPIALILFRNGSPN